MTTLRTRLEERLTELRKELADGEKMIADLQARQSQLRETLLRISGAVQVLEEELEADDEGAASAAPLQQLPETGVAPEASPAPVQAPIAAPPASGPAAWP